MRFRQAVAALSLAMYLPSCTGWHRMEVGQPTPAQEGETLRISLKTGHRWELSKVRISGDSLFGMTSGDSLTPNGWVNRKSVPTAVALVDIVKVEDRQLSATNTLGGILVGGMVLLFGVGYAVVSSPWGCC